MPHYKSLLISVSNQFWELKLFSVVFAETGLLGTGVAAIPVVFAALSLSAVWFDFLTLRYVREYLLRLQLQVLR